MTLACTKTKV